MSASDWLTLTLAICGAVLSTFLAARQVLRDRPALRYLFPRLDIPRVGWRRHGGFELPTPLLGR